MPPPVDASFAGADASTTGTGADGSSASADGASASSDASPPAVDSGVDGAANHDASQTGDSEAGSDAGEDAVGPDAAPATCNANADCSGHGAQCVNGQCAVQGQLCSDATQCAVAGGACVDGLCVPKCSASAPCPAGFGCDFTQDVCSLNPHVCSDAADCQGGTVCVEGHCAAPCAEADSGPQCPAGQICINEGCIPDQHAVFACLNDGEPGSLANQCDPSSICLHGDCYAACPSDGAACATGTECKDVTIAKGTFAVCAAQASLGSMCDPATSSAAPCSGGARCINGYCL